MSSLAAQPQIKATPRLRDADSLRIAHSSEPFNALNPIAIKTSTDIEPAGISFATQSFHEGVVLAEG
jgi:hypothetical protein